LGTRSGTRRRSEHPLLDLPKRVVIRVPSKGYRAAPG
jgi:hypothetical protein